MNLLKGIGLLVLVAASSFAQIKNFHPLSEQIYRSAAPIGQMPTVKKVGFTHVLIFKNEVKNEVTTEIRDLQSIGISMANIYHIPFRWKDMGPIEDSCEQVVTALDYLVKIERSRAKRILFHCTAGEDRTGALAGLYRMLHENWSVDKAFYEEMCPHGYEAGNPGKPGNVVAAVRNEITPVYLAVAALIMDGKLSFRSVSPSVCRDGGLTASPTFQALMANKKRYVCARGGR